MGEELIQSQEQESLLGLPHGYSQWPTSLVAVSVIGWGSPENWKVWFLPSVNVWCPTECRGSVSLPNIRKRSNSRVPDRILLNSYHFGIIINSRFCHLNHKFWNYLYTYTYDTHINIIQPHICIYTHICAHNYINELVFTFLKSRVYLLENIMINPRPKRKKKNTFMCCQKLYDFKYIMIFKSSIHRR